MEKGLNLLDPRTGPLPALRAPSRRPDEPALRRRPRPVRGRGGEPVGGHAQRPEPPAPRRQVLRDLHHPQRPAQRRRLRRAQRRPGAAVAEHEQRPLAASTRAPASSRTTASATACRPREFNFGAWYQSPSGELFFGGINGFNAFMPDRLRQRRAGAAGRADRRSASDHRPLGGPGRRDAEHPARLPRQGARPRVRGPRLHRPRPQPVRLQARGLRPGVGAPEPARASVTYTNLNPGRYTFRLRGANSDGRWNEEGAVRAGGRGRRRPGPRPGPSPATRCSWSGALVGHGARPAAQVRRARRSTRASSSTACRSGRASCPSASSTWRSANDELAQASITDSLTGLANRRFLTEYIEKEVALLHRRYNRLADGPHHRRPARPGLHDDRPRPLQDHQRLRRPRRGRRRAAPAARPAEGGAAAPRTSSCAGAATSSCSWPATSSGDGLLELAERIRTPRRPARLRDRRGARGADHLLRSASPATRSSASSSTR